MLGHGIPCSKVMATTCGQVTVRVVKRLRTTKPSRLGMARIVA